VPARVANHDERLKALIGRRVKAVHAFVEFQLGGNTLDVGGDAIVARVFDVTGKLVNRGPEEQSDNRDHEHDLEEGESTLVFAHK
jgi:hypothetical protein